MKASGLDLAGGGHVGAAAEVEEAVLLVGRDGPLEGLDQLELEGLVGEELACLVLGHFLADELRARGYDAPHLLLDRGQVLGLDGLGELEIVVEAVVDGRPDAELGAGVELEDGLGHHVGGRVTDGLDVGGQVQLLTKMLRAAERDKTTRPPTDDAPVRKGLRDRSLFASRRVFVRTNLPASGPRVQARLASRLLRNRGGESRTGPGREIRGTTLLRLPMAGAALIALYEEPRFRIPAFGKPLGLARAPFLGTAREWSSRSLRLGDSQPRDARIAYDPLSVGACRKLLFSV